MVLSSLAGPLEIGFPAPSAVFFIHPEHHTNGALRFQAKFLNEGRRFERGHNAGAIVLRALAYIP